MIYTLIYCGKKFYVRIKYIHISFKMIREYYIIKYKDIKSDVNFLRNLTNEPFSSQVYLGTSSRAREFEASRSL